MNISHASIAVYQDRVFSRKESFNHRALEAGQTTLFAHSPKIARLLWMMSFDGRPKVKEDGRGEYVSGYRPAKWFAVALEVCEWTIRQWWKILAKFGFIEIWRIPRGKAYKVRIPYSDPDSTHDRPSLDPHSINQSTDNTNTSLSLFAQASENPQGKTIAKAPPPPDDPSDSWFTGIKIELDRWSQNARGCPLIDSRDEPRRFLEMLRPHALETIVGPSVAPASELIRAIAAHKAKTMETKFPRVCPERYVVAVIVNTLFEWKDHGPPVEPGVGSVHQPNPVGSPKPRGWFTKETPEQRRANRRAGEYEYKGKLPII